MRVWRMAAMALGLSVVAPGLALAGDQADQRFQEGMTFAGQGKYEEARQAFLQAYALHATQPVLWNLAVSEYKTGRSVDALRHMKQYLRGAPTDPKYVQIAPSLLEKMNAETCHVAVDAPAGSDILVDGARLVDRAPLPDTADVAPGEHAFEARLGDKSARASVKCGAGDKTQVKLAWDAQGPAAALPTPAPTSPSAAPHGPQPGSGAPPETPASDGVSTARIVTAGSLGALGVTSAVLGAVFLSGASSKEDEAKGLVAQEGGSCVGKSSANCARVNSLKDEHDSDQLKGGIFLGVGGGLLVGGIAAFVFWPKAGAHAARIHPVLGVDRVGLAGTF